jgi:hypothetical protein
VKDRTAKTKTEDCRVKEAKTAANREGIADRTRDFSLRVLGLYRKIEGDGPGRVLGRQLLR